MCTFCKKGPSSFVSPPECAPRQGVCTLTQRQRTRGSRALSTVHPGLQSPRAPGHGCGAGPLFLDHGGVGGGGERDPGNAVAGRSPSGIKPAGHGATGKAWVCVWSPRMRRDVASLGDPETPSRASAAPGRGRACSEAGPLNLGPSAPGSERAVSARASISLLCSPGKQAADLTYCAELRCRV